MKAAAAANVAAYIAAAPAWARPTLREIRKAIRTAAPQAEEKISYGMPYYSLGGRLAYFAAFKAHCSYFWVNAADRKAFAADLAKLTVVGSTVRIPQGSKVPVAVIKKLVHARAQANLSKVKPKKRP